MTGFERNAPAMAVFYIGSFAMAAIYAALGAANGRTVLPDSYGPLVYAMPALGWAALQAGFAAIAAYGAAVNRPTTCAIGGFFLGVLYICFAIAAVYGGSNEVTLVAMAWPSAAIAWLSALIAWGGRNGG
jgi:hypothetical protein